MVPPPSPLIVQVPSIPGKFEARFLNSYLIFIPALALVSIKLTSKSLAKAYPSSVPTCLFSAMSILFPTRIIIKSFPLIDLASSIHLVTLLKLDLSSQKNQLIEHTGNVVDNHCHRGVLDVGRDQTSKSFLAGSIPELESDHLFIDVHCFREKVYSDSGLMSKVIIYLKYC